MENIKMLAIFGVSMISFVIGAQNLVNNGDAESGIENWSANQVEIITENPNSGKSCFRKLSSVNDILSNKAIPIDTTKVYTLSGSFRSTDNNVVDLFFGLYPFDEKEQPISAEQVNAIPETETEISAACKPEDTIIKIKDGSKWKISDKVDLIAFNVDNSGEYKDIPNRSLAGIVVKAENKNNMWELTLDKACGVAFPAGTKIRQHKYGNYFIYPIIQTQFDTKDWKDLSAEIEGVAKTGVPGKQFWHGTKYVKIGILACGGAICFDNIKLEEKK